MVPCSCIGPLARRNDIEKLAPADQVDAIVQFSVLQAAPAMFRSYFARESS
jgi:hypothetical protein